MRGEVVKSDVGRSEVAIALPLWLVTPRSQAFPWILLALSAGILRLLVIDRVPLSEAEAGYAFPVWQAVRGVLDDSLTGFGAPLFTNLVALVFWLFGPSDAAARLIPALAGIALSLTPVLLLPVLGTRAALAAGALLATSPITVELSRQVEPAMLSSVLAVTAVASAIRLATDRPLWAPWLLAASVGLGLACHPGFALGAGTAALAAYATWGQLPQLVRPGDDSPSRDPEASRRDGGSASLQLAHSPLIAWGRQTFGAWFGPVALGVGLGILGATGLLMDLAGIGFLLGGVWGGAMQSLAPAGFLSRYLAVFLAYALPLTVLAVCGLVLALRRGDRIAAFLGQWALLLIILSAGFGAMGTAGPALYTAPLAMLAGIAVERAVPWHAVREVTGAGWVAIVLTLSALVVILFILVALFGAPRPGSPIGWAGLAVGLALSAWAWFRGIEPARRAAAGVMLASILFIALTAGAVLRLSFGGSPEATEPLAPVQTDVAFRAAFRDLEALVRREPERVMLVDSATPVVARWYGRNFQQVAYRSEVPAGAIQFRPAPSPQTRLNPGEPWRVPLQTVGQFDPAGMNPVGIVRWAVARTGLVQARGQDIMIVR